MNLNAAFSKFAILHDGVALCDPCIAFTLFAAIPAQTEETLDLSGPYRVFLEDFRHEVRWCRTGVNQMHAVSVTDSHLAAWPTTMADHRKRFRGSSVVELRAGKMRSEWRPPSLQMVLLNGSPNRLLARIALPLSWFDGRGAVDVRTYLSRLLESGFPLSFGYVGYGLDWNLGSPTSETLLSPAFKYWLRRHPGLMSPTPESQVWAAETIVDIGWMSLLGSDLCAKAGGIDGLRRRLDGIADVTTFELPNSGAMIQIGQVPQIGDIEAGDALDAYRAVGCALADLRDGERMQDRVVQGLTVHDGVTAVERQQWINRFFC